MKDSFTKQELINILFTRDKYPVCVHDLTGEIVHYWEIADKWNEINLIPLGDKKRVADEAHMEDWNFSDYEQLCLLTPRFLLFMDKDYFQGQFAQWGFEIKD